MHVALKCGVVAMGTGALAGLLFACTHGAGPVEGTASTASPATQTGALVHLEMSSTVGVLLDEIPAGPQRDEAAANALAKPAAFWIGRAQVQTRLTSYRLVFRSPGPLPLTPMDVWNVHLTGAPHRAKIEGHELVVVDYAFDSYLVTDVTSPAAVEPALAKIGGTTDMSFWLPADPELLFQRTGYACMDEADFPPGSVFEENTWYYYDDTCTLDPAGGCHVTNTPTRTCVGALKHDVGAVKTNVHFTRVRYDAALATKYRVGSVNPAAIAAGAAADLAVVSEGLTDERAIAYRFYTTGSCELGEGAIGQLGWRRLLMFSAIVRNDGTDEINLGDVADPTNPYVQSNAFEFSACHNHYHFSHYGTFKYGSQPGSKKAFCLEDTNRYHNDETTPLTAQHQTCSYQGIGAGWGDEYNFGIPGQWVDITNEDTRKPQTLSFQSNPDQFLCEGTYARDASGNLILDPTPFTTADGLPVSRIRCNFLPGWASNNLGTVQVSSPGGSFVTDPCTRGQAGPLRDCGFKAQRSQHACTTGSQVTLTCTALSDAAEVLRICESSKQLGTGVACPVSSSVTNVVVGTRPTKVSFTCPAVRDENMIPDANGVIVPHEQPGVGGYSVYEATMGTLGAGDGSPDPIFCTGW
jgi:Lysyl oxidase